MPNPTCPTVIPILSATGEYKSPDTKTTTRTNFTDFSLRFQHAPDAHPAYTHLFVTHQHLAKLLIEHPAMRPNKEQTFCTPAKTHSRHLDPRDPYSSPMFSDVMGRTLQAKVLTVDETGQLDEMNASVGYRDDDGEFGDEIEKLANRLDVCSGGCAACGRDRRGGGRGMIVCARWKGEKYCEAEWKRERWKEHKKGCRSDVGAVA
ncbi:hypothetical protein CC86DRAFT_425506 [Ophiobolus disseminans]|uniref:MYND-type zinc finger protein samB n=1 Tax=Ophiobolus disseminans TaxID=1469910 RepID=A0A6A6ZNV9_9PLEO|nr:hypothetical protein CC86DRAFT_425506 [Ophiobolus disseminans]